MWNLMDIKWATSIGLDELKDLTSTPLQNPLIYLVVTENDVVTCAGSVMVDSLSFPAHLHDNMVDW